MAVATDTPEHATHRPTSQEVSIVRHVGDDGSPSSNTVALVGGAAGLYMFSAHSDRIAVLRDTWWARGALILLIGYYLHRKGNSYANLVIGIGIVLFTRGLQARDAAAKGQKTEAGDVDVGDFVF